MAQALGAARSLPSSINPTAILGALALYLPEPYGEQALTEALTTTRHTTLARRAILSQAHLLWGQDAGERRVDLVRRCLDTLGLDDCLNVLASAVPLVHSAGGVEALESCLETVHTVRRWWQTSEAESTMPAEADH